MYFSELALPLNAFLTRAEARLNELARLIFEEGFSAVGAAADGGWRMADGAAVAARSRSGVTTDEGGTLGNTGCGILGGGAGAEIAGTEDIDSTDGL